MNLPNNISEILNKALNEILNNPNGELVLPIRKEIWLALGDFEIEKKAAVVTTGLKRRVKLSILCIEHIINFWNEVVSDDLTVQSLIEKIYGYINGEILWNDLWKIQNDNTTKFENMMGDEGLLFAGGVGLATVRAAVLALYDESHLVNNKDNVLDENFDPYDWDTSYYSAMVFAGGGTWDANSSVEKRKDFWTWYVKEAVPKAYCSYL